jgi:hypothetical protein
MKTGMELIQAERARQVAVEGWSPEHDDGHEDGELSAAADCYLLDARHTVSSNIRYPSQVDHDSDYKHRQLRRFPGRWPWELNWWKPCADPVKTLIKAGALYLAEMERLDRLGVNSAHVLLWVKQVAAEIDFLQGGLATDQHRPTQTGPTDAVIQTNEPPVMSWQYGVNFFCPGDDCMKYGFVLRKTSSLRSMFCNNPRCSEYLNGFEFPMTELRRIGKVAGPAIFTKVEVGGKEA